MGINDILTLSFKIRLSYAYKILNCCPKVCEYYLSCYYEIWFTCELDYYGNKPQATLNKPEAKALKTARDASFLCVFALKNSKSIRNHQAFSFGVDTS